MTFKFQYPCHGPYYLDPQITDAHLDASVKHIIAVASPATTHDVYGTTVNHWCLFFVLSGDSSIVFKPYAVRNRSVKQVELPLGHQICTVRKAWSLLNSKGFLRYRYTVEGEDCRAWVANAANTFENDGGFAVQGTVLNTLWPIITQVWSDASTCTARDMQSGNFY